MKPWLQGDFGELEPKKQMDSLRDLVQTAAHRGTDLHPFWLGLAHLDPIACAELAAGPKAVAHPAAVESALIIVETLERIIAPSGLYSRLLQLAPSCGPRLSEIAAGRHPSESWIWRLDVGPMRGAEILKAHNGTPFFEQSCRRAARSGCMDALATWVVTDQMPTVLRAVFDAKGSEALVALTRRAVGHQPLEQILAIFSALLGPATETGLLALLPTLMEGVDTTELHGHLIGFERADQFVSERLG